jgi:hypothetical protein
LILSDSANCGNLKNSELRLIRLPTHTKTGSKSKKTASTNSLNNIGLLLKDT